MRPYNVINFEKKFLISAFGIKTKLFGKFKQNSRTLSILAHSSVRVWGEVRKDTERDVGGIWGCGKCTGCGEIWGRYRGVGGVEKCGKRCGEVCRGVGKSEGK